ncbi:MAG: DHH family phosphoesterase [Candidatus Saccharibacteria bacterium]|nr:DHH family phosphoesterase [Candidatus Saccharibacteria bacterium]
MITTAKTMIEAARRIVVVQAENPDGDSVGSSLALEEILGDLGKTVQLHCPIELPKYLRYIKGWDRVTPELDMATDLIIIVDTTAEVLLSKTFEIPGARHFFETRPVLVIDHHLTESALTFDHTLLSEPAVSTSEVIYHLASQAGWAINKQAAEQLLIALMSDSRGLTTQSSTAESFFVAGKLTELGASNAEIEERRREFMKKAPEILRYKGELLQRIEYFLDGRLALAHIPFDDIQAYSDKYNPSVLVLDEMRLVEGVEVAIAIKTYPDGKLTGKLLTNAPVAADIAGYFGGGGHAYAAGFRIYETYDAAVREVIAATDRALAAA